MLLRACLRPLYPLRVKSEHEAKVNEQLKTTNRRIYAVGDVIGDTAFTSSRQLSCRPWG
jgi:pyruvate/2-oxoglutarate dehydrogenase complex dihydrolipoamide dehydrogenase (E3) component